MDKSLSSKAKIEQLEEEKRELFVLSNNLKKQLNILSEQHALSNNILLNTLDLVIRVDMKGIVTFINKSALQVLGYQSQTEVIGKLHGDDLLAGEEKIFSRCLKEKSLIEGTELRIKTKEGEEKKFTVHGGPITNVSGEIQGAYVICTDITKLETVKDEFQKTIKTLRELATPIMLLWNKMLLLPIIGTVDSRRAQLIMETILTKIAETESRIIIMDILGVQTVDTAVANHLIKITKATKIMGCDCIITGVSPAVAQTMIQLGVDLRSVITQATLKDGLAYAFKLLEYELGEKKK